MIKPKTTLTKYQVVHVRKTDIIAFAIPNGPRKHFSTEELGKVEVDDIFVEQIVIVPAVTLN